MEKQNKRFNVKYNFDWYHGVDLNKMRKDLDELEQIGVTHIGMGVNKYKGSTEFTIDAYTVRLETDTEFNDRITTLKAKTK